MRRLVRGEEQGAVAVEFAILMPLLILVLFGIMQFGLFFFRWQGLQNLANVGARAGSIGLTIAQMEDRIEAAHTVPIDYADLQISVAMIDEGTNTVTTIDGKSTNAADQATTPCQGVANPKDHLVKVTLTVDQTLDRYKVIIPVWGTLEINYASVATFSCEASS